MHPFTAAAATLFLVTPAFAQLAGNLDTGSTCADSRIGELRTLNSSFPMRELEDGQDWETRRTEIKRRILVSQGLWPEPTKTDLRPIVHRRQEFDGYSIEAVYFESIPGHFVTGSLYRPEGQAGPFPAVLCPHGHWADARFYDAGEASANQSVVEGAERFFSAARNHVQARCAQLARMGCIALLYDTTGNSDSIQLPHRHDDVIDDQTVRDSGFFSAEADLRLQNMMGLQTWNSIRSIDFLLQLPDVDETRIGVTGASGGGTQSMIIAAVDDRIAAAMPCVMVSTAMQGGCSCENAPYLRINQGNVDIAASIAPRPLGLTAANDWTVHLETEGYPALKSLYASLAAKDNLTAAFHVQFKHNYNHVNRAIMYGFFNKHFQLGFDTPILEQDFQRLEKQQLTVWDDDHPAPSGDRVGKAHEVRILRLATQDSDQRIRSLVPTNPPEVDEYKSVIGGAWEVILGRRIDQLGNVTFNETSKASDAMVEQTQGCLYHHGANEQIPAMVMKTADDDVHGVAVWVADSDESELLNDNPAIDELLRHKFVVVTADLFGQGEFNADESSVNQQEMWYQRQGLHTWERYCAYTYGYNHPLFVKRTHDVLSLIKYAKSIAGERPVLLVGTGMDAGPIALAARSQVGAVVDQAIIDVDGFRFSGVHRHDSPRFLPGAVKYLDIDGLLSVCAPHAVTITGLSELPVATQTFAASGASAGLRSVDQTEFDKLLRTLPGLANATK